MASYLFRDLCDTSACFFFFFFFQLGLKMVPSPSCVFSQLHSFLITWYLLEIVQAHPRLPDSGITLWHSPQLRSTEDQTSKFRKHSYQPKCILNLPCISIKTTTKPLELVASSVFRAILAEFISDLITFVLHPWQLITASCILPERSVFLC